MAAGLGFKDFTTGEVLTAADVDGYLMQGIWVFTNATARDAAVTSPQEGNFAFTKDNNSLWYYDGAAWVASGATGDIEGVTAGIGISGGGTSGTVTVTNSMATAIDAKGDLVVGTGADTFSKLTVGANGTTLVADSAETTGLKWATPASGSMTLLSTTTLSGSSVTISGIDQTYETLRVVTFGITNATGASDLYVAPNGSTTISFVNCNYRNNANNEVQSTTAGKYLMIYGDAYKHDNASNVALLEFDNYADTDKRKTTRHTFGYVSSTASARNYGSAIGYVDTTSAITSLTFSNNSGYSFNGGTVLVYGVK